MKRLGWKWKRICPRPSRGAVGCWLSTSKDFFREEVDDNQRADGPTNSPTSIHPLRTAIFFHNVITTKVLSSAFGPLVGNYMKEKMCCSKGMKRLERMKQSQAQHTFPSLKRVPIQQIVGLGTFHSLPSAGGGWKRSSTNSRDQWLPTVSSRHHHAEGPRVGCVPVSERQ